MPQEIQMQSLAPILLVETIEPCLPFWVERLGFQIAAEVPEGDRLGFVMLHRDNVTVMYQSRASIAKDIPQIAELPSSTALYIQVANIDEVEKAMTGLDLLVPRRKTFYGATEIGLREPSGSVVMFSQQDPVAK